MAESIVTALKNNDFFNGLPDDVINELANQFEQSNLAKDEVLFKKGDIGDALYMIEEGYVKMISNDKDGGEVLLNTVGSGAVIGEMALIDDEPRSAGVVALTDVTYLKLSEDDFLKVLMEQPQLGIQISRNAIQRLRFATTYIENAIEWSKRIAAGDYSFLNEKKEMSDSAITKSEADQLRAERFLGTFFKMVEDIKEREDNLKKEVSRLKVEINQVKRKEEVAELADSEFFKQLRKKKEKRRRGRIIINKPPTITTVDGKRTFDSFPAAVVNFIINSEEKLLLLAHPKRNGAWEVVSGALENQ